VKSKLVEPLVPGLAGALDPVTALGDIGTMFDI
jgi:hypothetical protein